MRPTTTKLGPDNLGPPGRAAAAATLVDLPEVVGRAVDWAAEVLRGRNVRCVVDGPRPMHVTADPLAVGRTVLDLLLDAAAAVDPAEGGTVTVRYGRPPAAETDGQQFYLVVRDAAGAAQDPFRRRCQDVQNQRAT